MAHGTSGGPLRTGSIRQPLSPTLPRGRRIAAATRLTPDQPEITVPKAAGCPAGAQPDRARDLVATKTASGINDPQQLDRATRVSASETTPRRALGLASGRWRCARRYPHGVKDSSQVNIYTRDGVTIIAFQRQQHRASLRGLLPHYMFTTTTPGDDN